MSAANMIRTTIFFKNSDKPLTVDMSSESRGELRHAFLFLTNYRSHKFSIPLTEVGCHLTLDLTTVAGIVDINE